jgi:sugar/nucleoside kinase (ribokinase family)
MSDAGSDCPSDDPEKSATGEGDAPAGASVVIRAALSPADANAARDALLAGLAAAREAGTAFAVDLDGDQPWPCAVQLLAAAEKSAAAAGVPFAPGPAAEAARTPPDPDATP